MSLSPVTQKAARQAGEKSNEQPCFDAAVAIADCECGALASTARASLNESAMNQSTMNQSLTEQIKWDERGLVPAIAQQHDSGAVLMMAWMNREALATTIAEGRAVYYSRSRKKLWRKGEESGHVQTLKEIRIDCDGDVVLMQVEQVGGIACHTGRHNCFYRRYQNGEWVEIAAVLKDPNEIYRAKSS